MTEAAAKEDKKEEEEDLRYDYMFSFLGKSLRVKMEKWTKMLANEEFKVMTSLKIYYIYWKAGKTMTLWAMYLNLHIYVNDSNFNLITSFRNSNEVSNHPSFHVSLCIQEQLAQKMITSWLPQIDKIISKPASRYRCTGNTKLTHEVESHKFWKMEILSWLVIWCPGTKKSSSFPTDCFYFFAEYSNARE